MTQLAITRSDPNTLCVPVPTIVDLDTPKSPLMGMGARYLSNYRLAVNIREYYCWAEKTLTFKVQHFELAQSGDAFCIFDIHSKMQLPNAILRYKQLPRFFSSRNKSRTAQYGEEYKKTKWCRQVLYKAPSRVSGLNVFLGYQLL